MKGHAGAAPAVEDRASKAESSQIGRSPGSATMPPVQILSEVNDVGMVSACFDCGQNVEFLPLRLLRPSFRWSPRPLYLPGSESWLQ